MHVQIYVGVEMTVKTRTIFLVRYYFRKHFTVQVDILGKETISYLIKLKMGKFCLIAFFKGGVKINGPISGVGTSYKIVLYMLEDWLKVKLGRRRQQSSI